MSTNHKNDLDSFISFSEKDEKFSIKDLGVPAILLVIPIVAIGLTSGGILLEGETALFIQRDKRAMVMSCLDSIKGTTKGVNCNEEETKCSEEETFRLRTPYMSLSYVVDDSSLYLRYDGGFTGCTLQSIDGDGLGYVRLNFKEGSRSFNVSSFDFELQNKYREAIESVENVKGTMK